MRGSVGGLAPPLPHFPERCLSRQHDTASRGGVRLRSSRTAYRRPWASTLQPGCTSMHSVPGDKLMAAFLAYQAASGSVEEAKIPSTATGRGTGNDSSAAGGLAGSLAEQQVHSTAVAAGFDGRPPNGRCWLVGSGPGALEHVTVTTTFSSFHGACFSNSPAIRKCYQRFLVCALD